MTTIAAARVRESSRQAPRTPRGLGLIDLVVALAVVGVLLALLMPALGTSRERARRAQCQNNLKQLGLAALNHEQAHGFYPTGGWGAAWVGDPDRGFSRLQPGGWIYNILPYLEQEALHQLGAGKNDQEKARAAGLRDATPIAVFNCPARRPPLLYPNARRHVPRNAPRAPVHARADYAANVGDPPRAGVYDGPDSYQQAEAADYQWPDVADHTGISYQRSEVPIASVRDGTSNTYLIGEKYLNPDHYATGLAPGDDWSMASGYQNDVGRSTHLGWTPRPDQPGLTLSTHFGSAHPDGCNIVFCDGAVRTISFSIDAETHRRLGNRKDGLPIDAAEF